MENNTDFWEWDGIITSGDYSVTSSNLFANITFKRAKIEMKESSRINAVNDILFQNCKIHTYYGSASPRGIYPFQNCLFEDSQIMVPVRADLHYLGTGILKFKETEILDNVDVRGQGYELNNSVLDGHTIESFQSTLRNKVFNSIIQDDASLIDNSLTSIEVNGSEFLNNVVGIRKDYGATELRCSKFTGNDVGVQMWKLNSLNMSSLRGAGYNYFGNNVVNFDLTDAADISLEYGYNEIYNGSSMIFQGTLDKDYYTPSGQTIPTCPNIGATHNTWSNFMLPDPPPYPWGQGWPNPDFFLVQILNQQAGNSTVYCNDIYFNFGTVIQPTLCPANHIPGEGKSDLSSAKSDSSLFPVLTTATHFFEVPLDQALITASENSRAADSLNGDDFIASSMFYEVLTADLQSVNDSIDQVVQVLRWRGLEQYKSIIEGMVTDGLVLRENNVSNFDLVTQEYVNTLMHFTDSVKTDQNYKSQFLLESKKIALFRLLAHDEEALQIAVNLSYCDHDSLQQFILEELIANISFDISSREQGYLSLLEDSLDFELDSAIFEIPVESFIDSSGFGTYINGPNSLSFSSCALAFVNKAIPQSEGENLFADIYPNPASSFITVFLNVKQDPSRKKRPFGYRFEILSMSGQSLKSIHLSSSKTEVDISRLASGIYFYRLTDLNSEVIQNGKLIVER